MVVMISGGGRGGKGQDEMCVGEREKKLKKGLSVIFSPEKKKQHLTRLRPFKSVCMFGVT